MLEIIMSFKGYDERNMPFTTFASRTERGPQQKLPNFPGALIETDLENVDTVHFTGPDRSIKVFWSKRIFGLGGNKRLMYEDGLHDIALIETCGGEMGGHVLIARVEPTTDDRLGLLVSNKNNKALFIGTGEIARMTYYTEEGHLPTELDTFIVTFQPVYPWRRASAHGCAHGSGAVRNPGTTPRKMLPP